MKVFNVADFLNTLEAMFTTTEENEVVLSLFHVVNSRFPRKTTFA